MGCYLLAQIKRLYWYPELITMMTMANVKVDTLTMIHTSKDMSMEGLFWATGTLFQAGF